MFAFAATLVSNPTVVLYGLQAMTYAAAAYLSKRAGHSDLTICYGVSSGLNWMLCGCHAMQIA